MWNHRNDILKTPESQDHLLNMEAVNRLILDKWNQGSDILEPLDRRLFQTTIEELLQLPGMDRCEWLQAVQAA